jgi:hypothetical protein
VEVKRLMDAEAKRLQDEEAQRLQDEEVQRVQDSQRAEAAHIQILAPRHCNTDVCGS